MDIIAHYTGPGQFTGCAITHAELSWRKSHQLQLRGMPALPQRTASAFRSTEERGNDRVILAACQEEESSWSADTEGSYGEFSYHFMKAVNMEVPADANSNGFVSMSEAFNYASAQDSRPETPLYDDNGDGIGHSGPVPSGGDGTLGAVTYL